MNNTKQILPEDGIVISRGWLENEIASLKVHLENSLPEYAQGWKCRIQALEQLKSNTTPLTPIVEDAFSKGFCSGKNYDLIKREERLKDYLSYPITIKL